MGSCKSISDSAKEDLIVIATFQRLLRASEDDVPTSITGIVSQLIDELQRVMRCKDIKFIYFERERVMERSDCCRLMIEIQNNVKLGEIEYPKDVSLQQATLIKAISLFATQLIERIHLSQLSSSLIAMMEIEREYKSVPFVMQSMCKIVEDSLKIDFVSLFCCSEECIVPLFPQNMMCIDSLDIGILGRVATTKKSIIYNNGDEKKRLNLNISIEENVRMYIDGDIESLLCIPIFESDYLLLAINSKKKKFIFTNLEINLVETLSIEIGKFLAKRTTQLMLSDANDDDATKSMLKHFRASHFRSTLLSKQLQIEEEEDEQMHDQISMIHNPSPKVSITLTDFVNLSFDPFGLSLDEMINLTLSALNDLELINNLSIPLAKIGNFIEQMLLSYNDNPYHNKYHGFSVFGFLYSMIKRTNLETKLSQMDILSLLIAAISHDADHPGNTNNFEISTRSHLAHIHNDMSVLENHHCNVTFDILRSSDCNFTMHFKKSEKKIFRKRIIKSILATDMSHHFEQCEKLNSYDQTQFVQNLSNPNKNEKFIQIVCNMFVHTADVLTSACPLPLSIKWAKKICAEFTNQVKRERILGIESMQMMKDLENEEEFLKSQLNFIKLILHPLFKQAVRLFPALNESYLQMIENEKYFQTELDKLMSL